MNKSKSKTKAATTVDFIEFESAFSNLSVSNKNKTASSSITTMSDKKTNSTTSTTRRTVKSNLMKEKKNIYEIPSFKNPDLLEQALTHSSYVYDDARHLGAQNHYERLEFLGDSVLGLISAEMLFQQPRYQPGELTITRTQLVQQSQLAEFARQLDLPSMMRLGSSINNFQIALNNKRLCDAFEAVVGAYYVDNDYDIEPVRAFVKPLFQSIIDNFEFRTDDEIKFQNNPKGKLQTLSQNVCGRDPEYIVSDESGPDHLKSFVVNVYINDTLVGSGKGNTKKEAEKQAAIKALKRLQ